LACACLLLAHAASAQTTHTLKPTPKTVAWGYYDAKTPPVLRVKSGDTVEIQTLITLTSDRLEEAVRMMLSKVIFVSAPPPR
jgi:acetamidase/formamidase